MTLNYRHKPIFTRADSRLRREWRTRMRETLDRPYGATGKPGMGRNLNYGDSAITDEIQHRNRIRKMF